VKNRFQSLPFKCNLQRYTAGSSDARQSLAAATAAAPLGKLAEAMGVAQHHDAVGLCRLNKVYP
jgi:hypothetical protein